VSVVVDVGFALVLVLRVLMRNVGVVYRRVVVLMVVNPRQVLPLAQHLIRALSPVVRHMGMLMVMNHGFVSVFLKVRHVRPFRYLRPQR
jgi:hypothetical protein